MDVHHAEAIGLSARYLAGADMREEEDPAPKVSLPGLALAYAINSLRLLA
jgi:hypothetical protein